MSDGTSALSACRHGGGSRQRGLDAPDTRHRLLGFSWVRRPFPFVPLSLSGDYASDEDMPAV